jgi:hypothetical protein
LLILIIQDGNLAEGLDAASWRLSLNFPQWSSDIDGPLSGPIILNQISLYLSLLFRYHLVGLKRDQAFKFSMANPDRGDHANQSWAPAVAKHDW